MDYSKTYQGWIYCITNKINGKKYIGQTIDFDTRKKRHLKYTNDENSVLHNAIRKYKPSNFDIEVIVSFRAISEEVRRKLLDFLEIFYIKKYQTLTIQNGYNQTVGGGGMSGFHHSERAKKKMSESQKQSEVCVENWKKNQYDARRAILLYDLDGKFVNEYNSISDALIPLGKRVKPIPECVFKALKNKNKQAYGFLWVYKETDIFPSSISPYVDTRLKPVYYYNRDGQFIAKYKSARDASEKLGIKMRTIKSSLERVTTKKRRRVSNYWSYIPPAN